MNHGYGQIVRIGAFLQSSSMSYLGGAAFLIVSKTISPGTKIVLDTSLYITGTWAIAHRKLSPVSVVCAPPIGCDNFVPRSRVLTALGVICVLGAVVSLDVPHILNHEV